MIIRSVLQTNPPALLLGLLFKNHFNKIFDMADHIENVGKKGRFVMWLIIYTIAFILLLVYLYRYNFKYLG